MLAILVGNLALAAQEELTPVQRLAQEAVRKYLAGSPATEEFPTEFLTLARDQPKAVVEAMENDLRTDPRALLGAAALAVKVIETFGPEAALELVSQTLAAVEKEELQGAILVKIEIWWVGSHPEEKGSLCVWFFRLAEAVPTETVREWCWQRILELEPGPRELAQVEPTTPYGWWMRGAIYAGRASQDLGWGRYDLAECAVEDLSRAIELVPEDDRAYWWRGWAYHLLEEEERALADLNRAIELDPDCSSAYRWRAAVHRALGDEEAARADEAAFSRAVEREQQREQEQRTAQEAAYLRTPEGRAEWLRRASFNTHAALSNKPPNDEQFRQTALEEYSRLVEHYPNDIEIRLKRGIFLQHLGRLEEALADYDRLLQQRPEATSVYRLRAAAHRALGHEAESARDEETFRQRRAALPPWQETALELVEAPEVKLSRAEVEALAARRTAEDIPVLAQALACPKFDAEVRETALGALEHFEPVQLTPVLPWLERAVLDATWNTSSRDRVIRLLGRIGDPRSVPFLTEGARRADASYQMVMDALEALRHYPDEIAQEQLRTLVLRAEGADAIEEAAWALARLTGESRVGRSVLASAEAFLDVLLEGPADEQVNVAYALFLDQDGLGRLAWWYLVEPDAGAPDVRKRALSAMGPQKESENEVRPRA